MELKTLVHLLLNTLSRRLKCLPREEERVVKVKARQRKRQRRKRKRRKGQKKINEYEEYADADAEYEWNENTVHLLLNLSRGG